MGLLGRLFARTQAPPPATALELIRTWPLPAGMIERALVPVQSTVHVDDNLVGWVDQGLRQLYSAAVLAPRVAMPSRLVDAAWHSHITYTQEYHHFCQSVFGRYLHHSPESAMSPEAVAENRTGNVRRTWDGACRAAALDPAGQVAPALFAVDVVAGYPGARPWIGHCGYEPCGSYVTGAHCVAHLPAEEETTDCCGGCCGSL
jgi:hypothetical protein